MTEQEVTIYQCDRCKSILPPYETECTECICEGYDSFPINENTFKVRLR